MKKPSAAAITIADMQSLSQRLERFSVAATPAALTVFMTLFAAVPLHIPGAAQVMPAFALINIYYWNTFAPGVLPYLFLFALGLLGDTLTGLPMGTSAIVNILFALMVAREQRNFGNARFGAVWFGFLLLSFVAMVAQWVVISFTFGSMLPLAPCLLQWGATGLAYPAMHALLTRVYRILMT